MRDFDVVPTELGFAPGQPGDLAGGSAADNAARARAILGGESGTAADTVVLNAGAALFVSGIAGTLAEGCEKARETIDAGEATSRLDALAAFSRREADVAVPSAGRSEDT